MNQFFNFNKMITPTIIKVIFWIGVVSTVIIGLIQFFIGLGSPYGGGFQVFMGMLTIVMGPLVTRIYCELLIVLFKMHEALQDINQKIKSNEQI